MSVLVKDGIGFSTKSAAIYMVDGYGPDATKLTVGPEKTLNATAVPWSPWGSDNKQPIEMATMLEGCGVLSSGVDAKARIAMGKGLMPFLLTDIDVEGKEVLEFVNDEEIHDWLEDNDIFNFSYAGMYNEFGYGWSASQLILNGERTKINRIKATDVYDARLQKIDPTTGKINTMYLCGSWDNMQSNDPNYVKEIPVLVEGDELDDLVKRSKEGKGEFAVLHRARRNGRRYYPYPLWYAARKWVNVAMQIPEFKKALHENQMHIKYLIKVSDNYWKRIHSSKWDSYAPEKKQGIINAKLDDIDTYLTKTANAGKAIFSGKYVDQVTGTTIDDVEIEVLDDKMKDGKLLPDSSAANNEILFALMINPSLIGAGNYGGSSIGDNAGGSNVRESFLTQMMLLEAERKKLLKTLNIVAKFNGWTDKFNKDGKRLVFRYPSGLLTTLDTGKSTKSETL